MKRSGGGRIVNITTPGGKAPTPGSVPTSVSRAAGIALTKLDSSAKGGSAFAVAREAGVPIKFAGTGEKVEDFAAFDPRQFVKNILDKRSDEERDEVSE